jgi:hypothetical protein
MMVILSKGSVGIDPYPDLLNEALRSNAHVLKAAIANGSSMTDALRATHPGIAVPAHYRDFLDNTTWAEALFRELVRGVKDEQTYFQLEVVPSDEPLVVAIRKEGDAVIVAVRSWPTETTTPNS